MASANKGGEMQDSGKAENTINARLRSENSKTDKVDKVEKTDKTDKNKSNVKLPKNPPLPKGQTTLELKNMKMVKFEDKEFIEKMMEREKKREEYLKQMKSDVISEVKKLRAEKVELERLKVEVNANIVDLSERLSNLEKVVQRWEVREKEREAEWQSRFEIDHTDGVISLSRSESAASVHSRMSKLSAAPSGVSRCSGCSFSSREVSKMKRLMLEQERKERQNNVVIKGIKADENNLTQWVEKFFECRLMIKVVVIKVRLAKGSIIVTLSQEEKRKRCF